MRVRGVPHLTSKVVPRLAKGGPVPKPVPRPDVVGTIDVTNRPRVKTSKGIATVNSWSYADKEDGPETLIPHVSDEGKMMSDKESRAYWKKKGKNLGVFSDWRGADMYAQHLHEAQARMIDEPDLGDVPKKKKRK
jgi:hypothetical protein